MHVKIQPFGQPNRAINYLNTILNTGNNFDYLLCSAFLRLSGLKLIENAIDALPVDKIKVVVGGRNGITSYQAISFLVEKGISTTIVDTGDTNRLFHPKLYACWSDTTAKILLGSSNLTHSGMCNNIESLMYCELDLEVDEERDVLDDAVIPILELEYIHPENCFLPTTENEVKELLNEAILSDENFRNSTSLTRRSTDRESRVRTPRIQLPYRNSRTTRRVISNRVEEQTRNLMLDSTGLTLIWSKRSLSRRDLQIPLNNTSPSGCLSLTQGGHDIDQTTFFRNVAFLGEHWTQSPNSEKEEIRITIALVINGIRVCLDNNVKVSHNPRFEAGQGNYTTAIHWGNILKDYIALERFIGTELLLYRNQIGSYEIHLIDNV